MATASIILPVQSAKIGGAFITAGAGIDGGSGPWKLLFDASVTESGLWQFKMPGDYASNPVLKLQYAMASATVGKVDLEVDCMAVADGEDIDSASFDSINEISGGTTVPGTAGFLDTISIPLTNNDSVAANELFFVRAHRDHDDADDTATGDLELVSATLEYTTT